MHVSVLRLSCRPLNAGSSHHSFIAFQPSVNLWKSNYVGQRGSACLRVPSDADAYLSCSLEVRSHSQTSEQASAQRGSINDEFFYLQTQILQTITMATMFYTPQHAPTNTGRRSSMDQGRPTEKPKKERFKVLKDRFRSSKHDENKGQDVNNDQTSEKDQNEINATRGDELPASPNMV